MQNFGLHRAGLLLLLAILPLVAAGCRGDEAGGDLPPESGRKPTVASAPADATRPTGTQGRIPSPEEGTKAPAQTAVTEFPPTIPAQATATPRPANTPYPTTTPDPPATPAPIAYLPTPAPVSAPAGIYDYAALTTGRAHTCLLRNDGAVRCMGTVDRETPFPSPTVALESVSSGPNHACGLQSNGSVVCWGSNDRDPWYGHTTGQADPPEGAFTSVSAGGAHTCGIKANGTAACWGLNEFGEADPPEGLFASISAGGAHTCGVRPDGTLTCWGNDEFGQASPPPGEFLSVSSGLVYSCGLRKDGEVVCWGFIWAGEEPGEDGGCFQLCTYSELVSEEESGPAAVLFLSIYRVFRPVIYTDIRPPWGVVSE